MFIMNVRTAWNDYFPSTSTFNLTSQTYNSRQNPSNTAAYVSNCLFASITTSDHGSALSCTSTQYLLVESTSFFSCKTSANRGAIYFNNQNNGQCVLYEVCGYDCCTTNSNSYQFGDIYVSNSVSSKNYVNYSSISRCVNVNAWYTFDIYYGNIRCPSVNMSMNKYSGRSLYCIPSTSSNSVTCSLTYSSFADNYASSHTCLYLWTSGAGFEIKNCNIIRNTQGSLSSEGTIATAGNLFVEDSCIIDNIANIIFYQGNSNYRITLSNCTVDKTINNGYLTTQNTVTKSFILALNHMSTENCHSEYDSAGYLTPIIQTPSSSKNQNHYCECEKFIYRPQHRNMVSLI
jgi:hypothetical protein